MVAIEHRSKSSTTTLLSPSSASTSSQSTASVSTSTTKSTTAIPASALNAYNTTKIKKNMSTSEVASASKSAANQSSGDKKSHKDATTQELNKRTLKLDLTVSSNELDDSIKSPKSPIVGRLSHQNSLVSAVDVEDRKTLREALYQGIFHRHRRTIFAVGSFLRMLRSRNSQYNTIRSTSEGDEEVR